MAAVHAPEFSETFSRVIRLHDARFDARTWSWRSNGPCTHPSCALSCATESCGLWRIEHGHWNALRFFWLSFDSQGLAWACALITHWLGLSRLFLWWQVGSRSSDALEPRESKSTILKTIRSTSQQNPIAEPLTELRGQTNSHHLE